MILFQVELYYDGTLSGVLHLMYCTMMVLYHSIRSTFVCFIIVIVHVTSGWLAFEKLDAMKYPCI